LQSRDNGQDFWIRSLSPPYSLNRLYSHNSWHFLDPARDMPVSGSGQKERQDCIPAIRDRTPPLWQRVLSRAASLTRISIDRVLHAPRQRRAHALLQASSSRVQNVLFVCEGNIYRSPFAAARLSALSGQARERPWRVGSAGFVGPNRPSPHDAQRAAHRYGVDLSTHRSQLLNGGMLVEWDLIVVMEAGQARRLAERFGIPRDRILTLGDLDPAPIDGRSIADPWSDPEKLLLLSYARVERCVRALAGRLGMLTAASQASTAVDSGGD
jgi:low molecular weight protein-tyrosine phosphatase